MRVILIFSYFLLVVLPSCKAQDNSIREEFEKSSKIKLYQSRAYFLGGEEVFLPVIDEEVAKLLSKFKSQVLPQEKNEVYVPKDDQLDKRKISVIEGIKVKENWDFKIKSYEHNYKDILQLKQEVEEYFNSSEAVSIAKVDSVYLPVEYYDETQLRKLE